MDIDLELNYPKRVYKFYPLTDYNIDAFLNHYFFLSHPFHLNDLMDGRCYTINMRDINPDIYNLLKFQISMHSPSIKERYIYSLLDPYKDVNCVQLSNAIMASYFSYGGILSLTYDNRFSELMWSHYAQETGFMIEFDTDALLYSIIFHEINNQIFKKGYFRKVQYKEHPISINSVKYPNIEILNLFNATQKNREWKYEKEWRLIVTSNFYLGLPKSIHIDDPTITDVSKRKLYYHPDSIRRIYLGKKFWTIQNIEKEKQICDNVYEYLVKDNVILFLHELCKFKDRIYMSGACDCAEYRPNIDCIRYDDATRSIRFDPEYYYLTRSFEKIKDIHINKRLVSVVYDGKQLTQNEHFDSEMVI